MYSLEDWIWKHMPPYDSVLITKSRLLRPLDPLNLRSRRRRYDFRHFSDFHSGNTAKFSGKSPFFFVFSNLNSWGNPTTKIWKKKKNVSYSKLNGDLKRVSGFERGSFTRGSHVRRYSQTAFFVHKSMWFENSDELLSSTVAVRHAPARRRVRMYPTLHRKRGGISLTRATIVHLHALSQNKNHKKNRLRGVLLLAIGVSGPYWMRARIRSAAR